MKRKRSLVQGFRPEEHVEVDVFRLPVPEANLYAFIDKIEIERTVDHQRLYHIDFHCMRKLWFDALAEHLSDMPQVNTIAQAAGSCLVELTVPELTLTAIHSKLDVPHIQEDWWVELLVHKAPVDGVRTVPVMVYPPAPGSTDPVTIGTTGNSFVAHLQTIFRVRPPRTLTKLRRFSHNPDI